MKAKEIAKCILDNMTVNGVDAGTAVAAEFAADIQRFNADVKTRNISFTTKSSLGAWFRLLRDYNIKWNAVFREFRDDSRFWLGGKWSNPWFTDNDFARAFIGVFSKDASAQHRQELLDILINPSAMSSAFNRPKTFGPDPEDELRRLLDAML